MTGEPDELCNAILAVIETRGRKQGDDWTAFRVAEVMRGVTRALATFMSYIPDSADPDKRAAMVDRVRDELEANIAYVLARRIAADDPDAAPTERRLQ